jgi:uncharacterized membrane protein
MTTNAHRPPNHRLRRFIRILTVRPRLLVSAAVGLAVSLLLSLTESRLPTRLLIGWDAGTALYLVLVVRIAAQSKPDNIRRRARLQDEGKLAILVLTAVAAFAILIAIFVMLGVTRGAARQPLHLLLAVSTVALSWAFIHVIFGLHYAHEYYDQNGGKGGGLLFPGQGAAPDYWDFFYFSFVIGMCAQVSDIMVSGQTIRRTVFAHSVIAFIFNVALVALVVNLAASAILAPTG